MVRVYRGILPAVAESGYINPDNKEGA